MSEAASTLPLTDPEDLRLAQSGDEAAFGRVMRTHYEHVFRLVHSVLRNEHDATDVCQEVWLTVWKRIRDFRGDSKFTTWLHPIAVRRAIDHLRKRKRWYNRFIPFSADPEEAATVPEPATDDNARDDMERAERRERFEEALASLPDHHRTVLTLREVRGLSYEEIAIATKIPTGTVMSRLYHARRLLARQLGAKP